MASLEAMFAAFPQFEDQAGYIAEESHGSSYVPALGALIPSRQKLAARQLVAFTI